MVLNLPGAKVFIPDEVPENDTLKRVTHLAIGAHPDDIEIIASHGIMQCFQRDDQWFAGVVVTDGRGSPRNGFYRDYTDEEMRDIRWREQKKAAVIGEYAAQIILDYPSSAVKDGRDLRPVEDLAEILRSSCPEVVYTHNLADKHDTHVAVALRVIQAIRTLPGADRPSQLYGCEVWRDLDWLVEADKVTLDCSGHENLQAALLSVFDSQVSGGKRYDLATLGRRRAHATYFESHETDAATSLAFAMDLTPLVRDPDLDITGFMQKHVQRFALEVEARLKKLL